MSDNQKYTAIHVRIICTSCGNGCGEHLVTVGDNIRFCFSCIDKAKDKVDLRRKEITEKEIQQMYADMIKSDDPPYGMPDSKTYAELLYKAGYRKVE
ncbi:hypothetical protein [Proteus columbae]|uniref:hypothetical protein n=1 Tax=Proteus columbae TaxID=1987580 RepID=UPI00288B8EFE|nr:hypothetical protein [Proteus columbae]